MQPGETQPPEPSEHLGPLGYLAVALPPDAGAEGFARLLRLVEAGTVYVLDLELLTRDPEGVVVVTSADVDERLAVLEGANTHLLDDADLDRLAPEIEEGVTVAVLVYEDRSLMGVVRAWEDAGAHVIGEGGIDVDELQEALGRQEQPVGVGS